MRVGVPKEIKNNEFRVGLVPASVRELASRGNEVYVEKNAGTGSGISDDDYVKAGAKILGTAAEIYGIAEMIVKVKEPMPCEYELLKKGQIVFTYFHFAANRTLTETMLQKQIIAIAYETMTENHKLPLLEPMSEIAGRIAVQEGARYLEKFLGGSGVLLGGVPGVKPGKVLVLGGGVVGTNSALIAAGLRPQSGPRSHSIVPSIMTIGENFPGGKSRLASATASARVSTDNARSTRAASKASMSANRPR